ncbi:hypothetical protein [Ferrimonas balearica]|uniref:hypothetical protein n=1 Tax=Ferrimonas balearica TaxID=44012 RepID=UPI001C98B824|nr:hypothetical protein [Ferrimonas balearica]MBY5980977.1 hypothetical protein [Ferrimonas balearica]
MKVAATNPWRHCLNALAVAGALLPQAANSTELLSYCLNQIEAIGAPVTEPLTRHRQFGQLVLLRDQLKYLAESGDSDDLGRCTLLLNKAMGQFRPQPQADPTLLALQAQLIHLDKQVLKTVAIGTPRCMAGLAPDHPTTLDLEASAVSRYLNQASDSGCRRAVWLAYQNRGAPDARMPLRQYRERASEQARAARFDNNADQQLQHTPLWQADRVAEFLNQLEPDDRQLPWQPRAPEPQLSAPPEQIARQSLQRLVAILGLSLEQIEPGQWQLWDDARLLGYLSLQGGEASAQTLLQNHWIGLSPAVAQLTYRTRPWYPRHWHRWMAQSAETLVSMAGQPLPYASSPSGGAGYGFGRALARQPDLQQAVLGETLPPRPLYSAWTLYQARMGLAVAQQAPWSPTALSRYSERWFQHYFQQPAPSGLAPWNSHSDWAIAGARAYLPIWYAHQGERLLAQWQAGELSPSQIWLALAFADGEPWPQNQKSPAEYAGPTF